MSTNHAAQQVPQKSAYELIESAQTSAIQAMQLLEVAVDLAESTGADLKLNSVIRAARVHATQAADLAQRAEVTTPSGIAPPQAREASQGATYERDQVERLRALVLRLSTLSLTVGDIGYYLQNYANGYAEERDSKANQLQELNRVMQEACKAALAIIHRTPATQA